MGRRTDVEVVENDLADAVDRLGGVVGVVVAYWCLEGRFISCEVVSGL